MSSLSTRPSPGAGDWLRSQQWLWGQRRYRPGRVRGFWRVMQWLAILFFLIISLLPLWWLLRAALLGTDDFNSLTFVWWPHTPHWENFAQVISITEGLFLQWWGNTILLAIFGIINTVVVNGLAAYAFAKLNFPGKNIIYFLFLATLMIPGESTLVPTFLLIRTFGWYDTYLGQILPGAMSAFTIFLMRQFFEGLPRELEDAARIDGCNELRVFWNIIIPLSKPILAVIAVGGLMASIESFIWPLIVTESPEIRPIGVALPMVGSMVPPGGNAALPMAANLMMVVPTLIFLLIAQKAMVKGLAGSLIG